MAVRNKARSTKIGTADVMVVMTRLVEQSLINVDETGRYSMFESIRQFSGEDLIAAKEVDIFQDRHLEQVKDWAKHLPEPRSYDELNSILIQVHRERENIRKALELVMSREDFAMVLEILGRLWRFWMRAGNFSEPIERYREVLLRFPDDPSEEAHASAWLALGTLEVYNRNLSQSQESHRKALSYFETSGDPSLRSECYRQMGALRLCQALYGEADAWFDKALAVSNEHENKEQIARLLNNKGILAIDRQDMSMAKRYLEEALQIVGFEIRPTVLSNLALTATFERRFLESKRHIQELVRLDAAALSPYRLAFIFERTSELAIGLKEFYVAAVAIGLSRRIRGDLGFPYLTPFEARLTERLENETRLAMGEEEFERTFQVGRALSLRKGVEVVTEFLESANITD